MAANVLCSKVVLVDGSHLGPVPPRPSPTSPQSHLAPVPPGPCHQIATPVSAGPRDRPGRDLQMRAVLLCSTQQDRSLAPVAQRQGERAASRPEAHGELTCRPSARHGAHPRPAVLWRTIEVGVASWRWGRPRRPSVPAAQTSPGHLRTGTRGWCGRGIGSTLWPNVVALAAPSCQQGQEPPSGGSWWPGHGPHSKALWLAWARGQQRHGSSCQLAGGAGPVLGQGGYDLPELPGGAGATDGTQCWYCKLCGPMRFSARFAQA